MRLSPSRNVCFVALGLLLPGTAAVASTTTNIPITPDSGTLYANGQWANNPYNPNLSSAIPKSGNQGTGITFADWAGQFNQIDPSATEVFSTSNVALGTVTTVNTLFNTFYGTPGVDGEITFKNSLGQTVAFNLIGDDTIRDYHQNTYQNTLLGGSETLEGVTAENWWANATERLDVQTFYLPSSWAGTDLVSMTVFDPTAPPANPDPDLVLSALQVVSNSTTQVSATPEPSSLALLGTGMLGLAGAVRRRLKR